MEVLVREHWIEIKIPPAATLQRMLGAIEAAPQPTSHRIFIDASAFANADATTHALLGDQLAEYLPTKCRVALLVLESIISYDAERVAQGRRLNLRTFTVRREAENWLMHSVNSERDR